MNTPIVYDYKGSKISFANGKNVMVNATEMAKTFGKYPKDFLVNKQTKEFLTSLSAVRGISLTELVKVVQGGDPQMQGTWMHEDVALEFARWLSPAFAIWCNDRIKELLKYGMTATQPTLDEMVSNPDLIIRMATQLKQEREEKARLEAENARQTERIALQEQEIKHQAPKVKYVDDVLQSVNTYTSTQMAKELELRHAEQMHGILKKKGIMFKQSGQWLLTSKYSGKGYTKPRTHYFTHNDGRAGTNTTTVWTELGRAFLHKVFQSIKQAI